MHWKHSDAIFIVSLKIILITYRQYRQPSCIKKEHCVCEIAALRNAVVKWKGSWSNALGMVGVNVRNTKRVGDAGRTIFLQHHRVSVMQYAWLSDMCLNVWLTSTVVTFSPLRSWKFEEYYLTGCVRVQPCSKTMWNFYQTITRSIPEDRILHSHWRTKLLFETETSQSDRDCSWNSCFTDLYQDLKIKI